jgi:hypothetical protein
MSSSADVTPAHKSDAPGPGLASEFQVTCLAQHEDDLSSRSLMRSRLLPPYDGNSLPYCLNEVSQWKLPRVSSFSGVNSNHEVSFVLIYFSRYIYIPVMSNVKFSHHTLTVRRASFSYLNYHG